MSASGFTKLGRLKFVRADPSKKTRCIDAHQGVFPLQPARGPVIPSFPRPYVTLKSLSLSLSSPVALLIISSKLAHLAATVFCLSRADLRSPSAQKNAQTAALNAFVLQFARARHARLHCRQRLRWSHGRPHFGHFRHWCLLTIW